MKKIPLILSIILTLSIFIIAILFHVASWEKETNRKLDELAAVSNQQQQYVAALNVIVKKQLEIDKLKIEFNELVETVEAINTYIIWLEAEIERQNAILIQKSPKRTV